ncbi:hypothetical protein SADUNF_Sadunf12G0049000 [Salix dunnii]|uniref:Uncharacterized protein n=1 Tax=Salix dunnii TaxID=1413687 RepID=A0A835MMW8_9ROSI|nr:hypothetical protein SADUNF_Sadunf12G0049000 [Salix dunnii]
MHTKSLSGEKKRSMGKICRTRGEKLREEQIYTLTNIKDRLLERQFTRSNVARSVGYTAKEARSVTSDDSFVTIDNKKDERNAGATFGSAISTEDFGDSTSKHRREYDRYTSPPFRNGHKTNRTLILKEQFVVSLSEVGGLAEDARVVRSNMVENDQDTDIESRTNVLTGHHGCSITTSIRSSDAYHIIVFVVK